MIRKKRLKKLEIEQKFASMNEDNLVVNDKDVADTVAIMTGIPFIKLH